MRVNTRPRKQNAPRPAWKVCGNCGTRFERPSNISHKQWDERKACSYRCASSVSETDLLLRHSERREGPLETDCWIWTGSQAHGYGRIIIKRDGKRQYWRAHRLSYRVFVSDPGALFVCHRCDVRLCVNPNHLFLGTHQDNMADMDAKGRRNPLAGEKRRDAKLTEHAVREIRERNTPARILAEKFGVSVSTIYKARQGRSWGGSDAC